MGFLIPLQALHGSAEDCGCALGAMSSRKRQGALYRRVPPMLPPRGSFEDGQVLTLELNKALGLGLAVVVSQGWWGG